MATINDIQKHMIITNVLEELVKFLNREQAEGESSKITIKDFEKQSGGYCEIITKIKIGSTVTIIIFEVSIGDDDGPGVLAGYFDSKYNLEELTYYFDGKLSHLEISES